MPFNSSRFTLLLTEFSGVEVVGVAETAAVAELHALLHGAVVVPARVLRVTCTLHAWQLARVFRCGLYTHVFTFFFSGESVAIALAASVPETRTASIRQVVVPHGREVVAGTRVRW